MKKHWFFIVYTILLVTFTTLAVLNTYVFKYDYSKTEKVGNEETTTLKPTNSVYTDTSYVDDHISITITQVRRYETEVYVADITIEDISLLRTAFASDTYGKNIKAHTSKIAKDHNAIIAINGDYYGFRDTGYVIRNGILYDPDRAPRGSGKECLVIEKDGTFHSYVEAKVKSTDIYNNAWQCFTFGPMLIKDGEIKVTASSEVDAYKASNPRTAIARVSNLHYLMVVSDGRTDESAGLSLLELANVLTEFGAVDAYNLDGGGSSTMVFNNKVVNKPTSSGTIAERSVSDIVYIGY